MLWDRGNIIWKKSSSADKIYWLTFLFSLLVVWVHSFNGELFMGTPEAAFKVAGIERILGDGLGQIAVPGFFMVSSYLFFRGFCWEKLIPKWRSRLRSLVLPYLCGISFTIWGYVAATRLPGLSGVVGKSPILFNGPRLFDALVFYSYNPVFWYLFQLIILVALAPLVYTVMRGNVTGAAALGIVAFGLWKNWVMPLLNLDALFYFCAAASGEPSQGYLGKGNRGKFRCREEYGGRRHSLLAMGLLCTWAASEACCGSARFAPSAGGCGESAGLSWL
ncbi:MAG: acyltransferase family protein [Enterocloster clostridioformis]